jgi:hypothetical protein
MSKVKIILEKGETIEQVQEELIKAFSIQASGTMHQPKFDDPAMDDLYKKILQKYKSTTAIMLKEIEKVLKDSIK